MKNLLILAISFFFLAPTQSLQAFDMGGGCIWKSWFKYPTNNATFKEGRDIYVKVDPQQRQHIREMKLYVNGKFVRTESSYPFEWCKGGGSSDHYLRNMKPGTYNLKCRIIDKCGSQREIYAKFKIVGIGGGGPDNCHFNNPIHDLHWLKQLKHHYPNYKICQYYKHGKVFFKLIPCHGGSSKWYDCKGKQYSHISGAHFKKCWYNPCNGNPDGGHCTWKSWFEKCKPNWKGHCYDLYVRVGTQKYKDIAFMELYVNGQYVRKENNAPYEWGRPHSGGDHRLRNLQPGKLYTIKCRIKDRCGKWHEIYKKVKFHKQGS